MVEINKLKLIIAIIAIILGLMILLFELLWWRTYQTGFVIVGAVSVFVMIGGFFLIWRQFRNKTGDYKDIVADSEVQRENIPEKKLFDTEEPQQVKANKVWVGISLIVIGIVIIVVGIFGYNMEKTICPSAQYLCFFSGGGGMGLWLVNILGVTPFIVGIIFPYRKRIKKFFGWGYGCILFFLFIGIIALAMLLGFLTVIIFGYPSAPI
jgi:MFS family permease